MTDKHLLFHIIKFLKEHHSEIYEEMKKHDFGTWSGTTNPISNSLKERIDSMK